MNACQERPNQNIIKSKLPYSNSSFEVKSTGMFFLNAVEFPKIAFIQVLKKNVGASK